MQTEQPRPNTTSLGKERLLRILGVTFGVAVGIGGTIGIGILRIPGSVAAQLGHSGLIMAVWIISGLYAFAGANTYAELGTMLPLDGGPYVYARRAYGEFGGFLVGWSDWLLRTSSMAYLAIALTEYAAEVFSYNPGVITPAAIAVLIFSPAFHWLGVRVDSRPQEIMSLFKVLPFFVIIAACFLFSPKLTAVPSAKPSLFSEAFVCGHRLVDAKHSWNLCWLACAGLLFGGEYRSGEKHSSLAFFRRCCGDGDLCAH
jgi:amino acid transporter